MNARKGSDVASQILGSLGLNNACSIETEVICEALTGKIVVDEAWLRNRCRFCWSGRKVESCKKDCRHGEGDYGWIAPKELLGEEKDAPAPEKEKKR